MKIHEVIRKPLVTEKSTIAREEENVITFSVDPRATKYDIKGAVETLFNVDVITVRTMRMPRKKRRLGRFFGWKSMELQGKRWKSAPTSPSVTRRKPRKKTDSKF